MAQSKCRICGHSGEYPNFGRPVQDAYPPYLFPFMTSNDVPPGLAKAQIEQQLTVETKVLTELDLRIADLRLQLDELVWQRERRQQRIRDCKFALKPIRRLPAEILSEIFLLFVTDVDVYLEHESSIDPTQTIWILPQVCRRWRTVALSLHRLWSTVRLLQSDFSGALSDGTSFMLATQLYRAGNSDLSVSVFSQLQLTTKHPLFQTLLATAEKWKELVIIMPSTSIVSLSRHCPASFPNLTSLHIWPVDHKRNNPTANALCALQNTFQFCPKLFAIRTYPICLPLLGLPLNQVKQFGTSSPLSADLCIGALKLLPNLLDFVSKYDEERAVDNLQQLRHGKLDKLTIFNRVGAPRPIYLFQYLQAPSLRTLGIHNLTGIKPLLTFLTNSGRRLIRLQLESDSLTDADCVKILEKLPCLGSLTLRCPLVYTRAFGEHLITTDRANEPMIVPSLTFLELVGELVGGPGVEALQIGELKEARPRLCSWWYS